MTGRAFKYGRLRPNPRKFKQTFRVVVGFVAGGQDDRLSCEFPELIFYRMEAPPCFPHPG
jgi:hypothetical protein